MHLCKKTLTALLCAALLLCAGCGPKKTAGPPPEVGVVAARMLEADIFTDQMTQTDAATAQKLYDIPAEDLASLCLFVGTGATAEELGVFAAKDDAAASRVKEAAQARIQAQRAAFADYLPLEVGKIDEAIIQVHGTYVLVCVPADSAKAQSALKSAFDPAN
nr:DUF4358 domain-containing protein [Maliibacterium massiliense]